MAHKPCIHPVRGRSAAPADPSRAWHGTGSPSTGPGQEPGRRCLTCPAMAEQSHRDEMSAAIRAQRERQAAPRTIAPADEPIEPDERDEPVAAAPEPEAEQAPVETPEPRRRSMLDRLRRR
jgi:hypothetical protein